MSLFDNFCRTLNGNELIYNVTAPPENYTPHPACLALGLEDPNYGMASKQLAVSVESNLDVTAAAPATETIENNCEVQRRQKKSSRYVFDFAKLPLIQHPLSGHIIEMHNEREKEERISDNAEDRRRSWTGVSTETGSPASNELDLDARQKSNAAIPCDPFAAWANTQDIHVKPLTTPASSNLLNRNAANCTQRPPAVYTECSNWTLTPSLDVAQSGSEDECRVTLDMLKCEESLPAPDNDMLDVLLFGADQTASPSYDKMNSRQPCEQTEILPIQTEITTTELLQMQLPRQLKQSTSTFLPSLSRLYSKDVTWKPGIYSEGTLMPTASGHGNGGTSMQPSRFCHICLRRAERVPLMACSRLRSGVCRKVICERCFIGFGWDWNKEIRPDSGWTCTHCRQECPSRAQCFIYKRTNDRRHQALIKRRGKGKARKRAGKGNKREGTGTCTPSWTQSASYSAEQ